MRFHSAISDDENSDDALERVIESARDAMDGQIDAIFVFFTAHHRNDAANIIEQLWLELDPQCAIGCCGEGVIGDEIEIERQPGLAMLACSLPGVRLHPFRIAGASAWREAVEDADALRERIGIGEETRAVIAFGDPYSTPVDPFLNALATAGPGLPLIGGMASGGRGAGQSRLIRNDEVFTEGVVGLSMSGPLEVASLVSQGCRPIGKPLIATRSRDNIIEQLGGKPAMAALREVVAHLSPQDQALLEQGLMMGRAISEYRENFGRGDFLVRNVIGVDEENGSIKLADHVRTGQTVQFHLRDAATADEDLRLLLAAQASSQPAGGLIFSCNGRGTRMFKSACHDIDAAHDAMPDTPFAGFFAAGEFGPVGKKNFIHGHTASFALFSEP